MIRPLHTARRRALLIASGTAVLLAVGGGATAAVAATTGGTPTPSTTTPAACAVHLRAELRGATPKALKADLKTLRSEPKGAKRVAERKVIRDKALTGAYGARAGKIAHIAAGKAGQQVHAALPAALKADLKTLRATAPKSAARTAERMKIEQKALAGDYGTTIQTRAKTVHARFQARCAAKTAK